jgi:GNAT superfamily N-acetyltransferase
MAPPAAWQEYASQKIQAILDDPHTQMLVRGLEEEPEGLIAWSYLPWDSRQFGFPAARIEFLTGEGTESLLRACLEQAQGRGIRHLIARPLAADLDVITALTRAGFEFLDGIQTFSSPCRGAGFSPRGALAPPVRLFDTADLPQVLEIARTAYTCDRFHRDCALPAAVADRVNQTWVRNSCLGVGADAVLVAGGAGEVQGFVTCKVDPDSGPILGVSLGTIGMVATSVRARRRGLARALTEAALEWFESRGVGIVEVGTQLANVPAARLYESCGFRQVRSALTLRRLLE